MMTDRRNPETRVRQKKTIYLPPSRRLLIETINKPTTTTTKENQNGTPHELKKEKHSHETIKKKGTR